MYFPSKNLPIANYLDATYLKTPSQANISSADTKKQIIALAEEANTYNYKLVMVRPLYITLLKRTLKKSVLIGTVIDFPEGKAPVNQKLKEAKKAIDLGANELDFVVNYSAFKDGNIDLIKEEVTKGTAICLKNNKVVKWIIEVAALSNEEIIVISRLIKQIVLDNFGEKNTKNVFVKSSTGFYKTKTNKPNGATIENMRLIVENAKPLKIKAAGGIKNYETAQKFISFGVDRIGTSSAKEIVTKKENKNLNNLEY